MASLYGLLTVWVQIYFKYSEYHAPFRTPKTIPDCINTKCASDNGLE
jgi:hypothetical protein